MDLFSEVFFFVPYSWKVLFGTFVALLVSSLGGAKLVKQIRSAETQTSDDVRMVLGATLTLLGLAVGFSFSMAISGYNARQASESAEAAAIGSAYAKADLLPAQTTEKMKLVLAEYVAQRIQFYTARSEETRQAEERQAASLRRDAWQIAVQGSLSQPNSLTALAVATVGDLQKSYETTSSTWRKQIPSAAWGLIVILAVFCNVLVGYSAGARGHRGLLIVFPLVIAISLALINDIDVPGHGLIHVSPVNLERMASELSVPLK